MLHASAFFYYEWFVMQHFSFASKADERLAWVQLALTEGLGYKTLLKLLSLHYTPSEILRVLPKQYPTFHPPSKTKVEDELAKLTQIGGAMILACDQQFPLLLRHLVDCPMLLTFRGDTSLLTRNSFAIVGTRNASLHSSLFAQDLARALGQAGLVITSGLARGIDGAAHKGSLKTGTIAVVAGGVDVIYPKEHTALYHAIAEQGLIVAELPPGTIPKAGLFPRRNRIIAGLSLGVVVVEAALQSGSLITANMALDQGKPVFAVPGSPQDPRSRGNNALLRDGAIMVESYQDIINEFPVLQEYDRDLNNKIIKKNQEAMGNLSLDSLEKTILGFLNTVPIPVEKIISELEIPIENVLTVLMKLELSGMIKRNHEGVFCDQSALTLLKQ